MGSSPATRIRLLASLALAGVVAIAGLAAWGAGDRGGFSRASDNWLERLSYDVLHSLAATNQEALADSPVVIVYLDMASFGHERLDPIQPWPRNLHAKLLERLTAAGARAVIFDIVFGGPGSAAEADDAFAAALRANQRTVLAAEFNNKVSHDTAADQPGTRASKLVPPFAPFAEAAAGWGIASLWIDDDLVVRRHLPTLGLDRPSLSWAAARWLHLPVAQEKSPRPDARWIRYYGPPLAIPHVSYSEALEAGGVPDSFFRNKIVFVGARPMESLFHERRDEFRSPFHSWSNKEYFTPGVEVHATQMLNLVRGDWLRRLAPETEALLIILGAIVFGMGLLWLRPIPATVASVAGGAAVVWATRFGFSRGVWFPWLIVAAVQVPLALFGSWLFQFQDWFFTRRRLEVARREAEIKIREQAALIDKAHDAILVQDLDGRIRYANPSAERLYGWPAAELQREGFSEELSSPDASAARTARATALHAGEWNGELRQQTRDGKVVTVASRWTLLRSEAGQPTGLLLINTDVTDQKQLEAQFLRTQRMNTIGTLAGGMAHDLNNALAPILMGVQLLRRKASDEESARLLGLMETNTHRGADMVRQVLLFARGRGGEFERLELGPLVKELEKIVRETFPKSIAVETFLPADLWQVRGNPTQLHQVLLNLCVNARDAMPSGGRLSFAADNVELTTEEAASIPGAAPGQCISLLVSDTGTGMPAEVMERIFEPFFSTKGEGHGTGIGLSTVQRIVKAHGGFIRVESQPGQGTVFEIFLPRAAEAPVAPMVRPDAAFFRGNGELSLGAEDERAIRELVSEGLTAHGYRVVSAANGAEALRRFEEHEGDVRLLVTDTAMPVMDGLHLINKLRGQNPKLPIIVASGEAEVVDSPRLTMPDDVVRLGKPFALEELLAAIARCLEGVRPNPTRSELGND